MSPRQVRRPAAAAGQAYQPYYQRPSHQRRDWRRWLRLSGWLLVASLLIGAAGWGFHIKQVKVEQTAESALVAETARAELRAHPLWSNLLLLPADQLAAVINQRLDTQIAEIRVHKQWFSQAITIATSPRGPALQWQTAGQLFEVDQTGRVIQQVSARNDLPLVIDSSNVSVALNQQVLSRQFVTFAGELYQQLPAGTGLKPTQLRLGDTTNEVAVDTSGGFYIRCDTTRGVAEQIQAVSVALAEAKSQNAGPREYIDVRIPYKVYYR